MKLLMSLLAVFAVGNAFADAPDCSKFTMQLSYNAVEPIKDIQAGKIVGSVRMYSDRCEAAGQTLEVVYGKDPADPVTHKRPAQARIAVTKVTKDIAWAALSDVMAKAQGLATGNDLRNFLMGIYGKGPDGQPKKDENGNVVDITKATWSFIEFKLVK